VDLEYHAKDPFEIIERIGEVFVLVHYPAGSQKEYAIWRGTLHIGSRPIRRRRDLAREGSWVAKKVLYDVFFSYCYFSPTCSSRRPAVEISHRQAKQWYSGYLGSLIQATHWCKIIGK